MANNIYTTGHGPIKMGTPAHVPSLTLGDENEETTVISVRGISYVAIERGGELHFVNKDKIAIWKATYALRNL